MCVSLSHVSFNPVCSVSEQSLLSVEMIGTSKDVSHMVARTAATGSQGSDEDEVIHE